MKPWGKVKVSRNRGVYYIDCTGCDLFEFWPLEYPVGWVLDRMRLHLAHDCPGQ